MKVEQIAQLLKDAIGMDAASVGLSAIERAVRERQAACGAADIRSYYEQAQSSRVEMQALVEAVVVPETWFFRDPGAFEALARVATDQLRTAVAPPLRLLSVPSSTGEEPYSIAMTLLDAGIPGNRFQIDAIDVSEHALARAAKAVYGRNSFRGTGSAGKEGHFDSTPAGAVLHERVRRQVRFRQGNVLSPPFVAGSDAFDIIFCRNLLIYFDRDTQERAIAMLASLLKPAGILFVGSSEGGVLLSQAFTSVKLPMAFAFKKGESASPGLASRPKPRAVARPPAAAPVRTAAATATSSATAVQEPPVAVQAAPEEADDIVEARRLADEGRFVEAAICCARYLRERGPSADAFYLLGLVRDASGNAVEAAAYYRKTLYLDPRHYEAVTHLALLVDRQGHAAEAAVLWRRARRLAETRES